MENKHGLACEGCHTPLVLAPGLDFYCPNKECHYEMDLFREALAKHLQKEAPSAYLRGRAKQWFKQRVGDVPDGASPNWTYERVAAFTQYMIEDCCDWLEKSVFPFSTHYDGLPTREDLKEIIRGDNG